MVDLHDEDRFGQEPHAEGIAPEIVVLDNEVVPRYDILDTGATRERTEAGWGPLQWFLKLDRSHLADAGGSITWDVYVDDVRYQVVMKPYCKKDRWYELTDIRYKSTPEQIFMWIEYTALPMPCANLDLLLGGS